MRKAIGLLALAIGVSGGASFGARAEDAPSIGPKLQPYIGCINRLSERAHSSEARYFSWVKGAGPTGKERVIYGLYTIYDTADCRAKLEAAARMAPPNPDLEKAGADYASSVGALETLLKEADDYYQQGNYKDDKMAKGKAMHPKLVAAWSAFNAADLRLNDIVDRLNDQVQLERLAAIEKQEGRKARYFTMDLMLKAKTLTRVEGQDQKAIDVAKTADAIAAYEATVKALEQYSEANPTDKAGSTFIGAAKSFLTTSKELMRRVRDKTPYSSGERMILSQQGAGWMVEGSPPRFTRDYNTLVERFNSGARF